MFKEIGKKLMDLAYTYTIIGIIASIILSISLFTNDAIAGGVVILILGPLLFWVSSWVLYGFGKLIDNSNQIVSVLSRIGVDDLNSNFRIIKKSQSLHHHISNETNDNQLEENDELIDGNYMVIKGKDGSIKKITIGKDGSIENIF